MTQQYKENDHPFIYGKLNPEKVLRSKELRQNQTLQEKMLWDCIRKNKLAGFHFRRQHVIDGFIVDFYCHQIKLVVEIDGPIHLQQIDYDREREKILRTHGLHLIRFTNQEVLDDLETVLQKLRVVCFRLKDQNT